MLKKNPLLLNHEVVQEVHKIVPKRKKKNLVRVVFLTVNIKNKLLHLPEIQEILPI